MIALVLTAAACSSDDDAAVDSNAVDSTAVDSTAVDSTETTDAAAESTTTEANTTTAPSTTAPPDEEPTDEGGTCAPGPSEFVLDAGSVSHDVRVFTPSIADGSPLPVVLNWHGLGSNGPQQADFSAYEGQAETEGFIVVHPTGQPGTGDDRNAWELEQFDVPDRDDVAMASALIDRLVADYCADEARVYSTGMSNGGFFTSRLVCDLSDRIAAAVSVAGLTHPDSCEPSRPVPFMAFHGTADNVVPFSGGESVLANGAAGIAAEFFEQSMPEEFAQFAADAGCGETPAVTEISNEVIRYDYSGCNDDVPLVFFEIVGGGHTWPGSPLGPLLVDALGLTTDDVSATADGWAFMSQFELP